MCLVEGLQHHVAELCLPRVYVLQPSLKQLEVLHCVLLHWYLALGISDVDIDCDHVDEELSGGLVCQEVRFEQVKGKELVKVKGLRKLYDQFVGEARGHGILVAPN